MSAVERSAPAWGCPEQDWCQNHCYQQTGHRAVDRVYKQDRKTERKDRKKTELLFRKNLMKDHTGTVGT